MCDQVNPRSEYSLIFESLSNSGIPFCLLRDELQGGAPLRDLDVLVDDERFGEALEVLQDIGYRVKVTERYIPFKTALVRFTNGQFIVLDVHRRLVQGGIVYMDHRAVLSRRRPIEDYFLPTDSDLLAILVFHNIIGKRRIQPKHYPQIQELSRRVERVTLQESLSGYGTYSILCRIIDELDEYYREPARTARAREQITKRLRRANPRLRQRLFFLRLRRWWRRYDPRPRAPVYALVGVDGSGKSSLSTALVDLLNRQSVFSAVVQYMGPWGHHHLKSVRNSPYDPGWSLTLREWLAASRRRGKPRRFRTADTIRITFKAILGRPLSDEERGLHQIIREHSRVYLTLRLLRSLLQAVAFFTLLTAEMYYRYWRIYRLRRRGTIVIADRYIYDLMTGAMRQTVPHYRRTRRLLCRLFFRPTRVFLLRCDPATVLARKKDLSPEVLSDFQAIYDGLAGEYSFEVIQSDKPPEILAQILVEQHFDELLDSVRT